MCAMFRIAVAGAHLSGFPLNHQLLGLGAKLIGPTHTAPVYKLYDLGGVKPSLVRQEGDAQGASIELELWDIPMEEVGKFISEGVKAPLAIGDVLLADGSTVKGFVGEAYAVHSQPDISHFGGWRAFKDGGK